MTQQYESEILNKLMERDGFNIPSSVPPYEAEIKAYLIEQVKLAYPKLNDYEAEWLLYNYTNKDLPVKFPIETITNVNNATVDNVVPYEYKNAILKGNTKYRDIDTGDILDTFDETKNLELVSVKMPVLTTIGKNLFDMNAIVQDDFELNKYQRDYYGKEFTLQPNTTYTIKAYLREDIANTSVWTVFNVVIQNKTFNVLNVDKTGKTGQNEIKQVTFTTDSTGKVGYSIYNHLKSEVSWLGNLPFNIQLEEGSTATPFEPHKSNILTSPSGLELRGIGEVQDTLNCLTGEVTERIAELVLDGSHKIVIGSDNIASYETMQFFIEGVHKNGMLNHKQISDKLPYDFSNDDYEHFYVTNERVIVFVKKSKLATQDINGFKQYLLQNPLTVQYQLATESVKTVDLSIADESGNEINYFMPIEGTMHIQTDGEPIKPSVTMEIPVEATTQNLASFIEMEV